MCGHNDLRLAIAIQVTLRKHTGLRWRTIAAPWYHQVVHASVMAMPHHAAHHDGLGQHVSGCERAGVFIEMVVPATTVTLQALSRESRMAWFCA
jgi:hypothetical protein